MPDFRIKDNRVPEGMGTGLIERDFSKCPLGYNSKPFDLPLIPKSEWEDRLRAINREKGSLRDLRKRRNIKSTNQGQTNFCWAHSSTSATMLVRASAGQPHVDLSAASIACKIYNFQNRGGWGANSLEYIADKGICELKDWPQGPNGIRKEFDTSEAWERAKQYRVTEWMDLDPRNVDQMVTCFLSGFPLVCDFNWWGHSVAGMWFDLNPFKLLIWNSWGDEWGENGEGWLEGSKALPDGILCPRVSIAA